MKFMITFTHVEGVWERLSPEQHQQHGRDLAAFCQRLEREQGSFMQFFHPPQAARTVRMHESGEVETLEGPWPPTRTEAAGGFFLVEADDIEQPLEWAEASRFMTGANEVRALVDEAVARRMFEASD